MKELKKVVIALLLVILLAPMVQAAPIKFGMGPYVYNALTWVVFRFGVPNGFAGGVGAGFINTSAGNQSTTQFGILGKVEYVLARPTYIGGALNFISFQGGSQFSFGGMWGAKTMVTKDIELGVELVPIVFTSASANNATQTTFSVGSGAIFGAFYL